MLYLIRKILTVMLLIHLITSNSISATDWQCWANFKFNKKINKKMNFLIGPQIRTKQDTPFSLYWTQFVLGIQNMAKYKCFRILF